MNTNEEACALCGLPLRYGRFPLTRGDRQTAFCCQGCRQVFIMLSEASEAVDPAAFRQTDLYRQCVTMGVIPRSEAELAATVRPDAAARRDGEDSAEDRDPNREEGLSLHLTIEGMWCPACAWVIEETVRKQPGIHSAGCNFSTDRLRCTYAPAATSPAAIAAVIQRLGYRAVETEDQRTGRQRRRFFVRFAVSAFLTMNVMMLSFALYTGFFTVLETDAVWKISWPMLFLATGVMFYGGLPLHRKGLAGILGGQPGMEALISIGAVSAYSYSIVNLLKGSIHLYFDTACMLILLVQLGKLLERQAKDRIQEDLGHYYALMPAKVYLCPGDGSRGRYVSVRQLTPGDHFRVSEGETLAADGPVVEGRGFVDAASLTGEARPLSRGPGDRLTSGMRVIEGTFLMRAEKVGGASTLGQMLAIMDAALTRKTPVEGLTDRILRLFVPTMVLLALATVLVVLVRGAVFEEAFIRGLTVLVISCPCALGVAVPLARVAGVSLAARQGMLVQDFAAFDQASRIDTVVFDKTGTLTQGRWQLQTVEAVADFDEETLLALAAGLEQGVDHPVAVAVTQAAAAMGIEAASVSSRRVQAWGVAGSWQGRPVRLGRPTEETVPTDLSDTVPDPAEPGDKALMSWIELTVDGRLVGRLGFGDQLKPKAAEAVERLPSRGLEVHLVSGDSTSATGRVGNRLGIVAVQGGQLPADKARYIESLQERGRFVAMVGDGVNDAPALATADLSVAVFAGRQLGEEAQAVTLMQGDPLQFDAFLRFAAAVNRTIHQNLGGSVVYNLVSIPIAMAGWLSPLVAVVAMLLSSLSVTGNTLLLIRRCNRATHCERVCHNRPTSSKDGRGDWVNDHVF
jgi:heavy metal translocating P-type ATPase